MRILFVKESQNFPRSSGHDVHGFHMMEQLERLGHSIGLLTASATAPRAIQGLDLVFNSTFAELPAPRNANPLPGLQGRFVSYWGIDPNRPYQISELVDNKHFDAVVAVGLHVLPYLATVKNALRIWYAADEWLLHHWSQFRLHRRSSWGELKDGAVKGLYERAFNSTTDRVWAVSPKDEKALRWVMGAQQVDILPNGVDAQHYHPLEVNKAPKSCVFWGRLDFGPNLDAIRWFGEKVWTPLRRTHPDAIWKVFGFCAQDAVMQLKNRFEFELTVDLPDLRTQVQECQIVVLPFVSGGGIKNKLLEAAAMGMPIVASSKALNGILTQACPILTANSPSQWIITIEKLWKENETLSATGKNNRQWVSQHYTWQSAAKIAEAGILATAGSIQTNIAR